MHVHFTKSFSLTAQAVSDDERGEVADFRAQLLRQMLGGEEGSDDEPNAVDRLLSSDGTEISVTQAATLTPGQILVANPERFCSRNPFARPVRDLGRFGLQGPIANEEGVSADMKAQMLPVRPLRRAQW